MIFKPNIKFTFIILISFVLFIGCIKSKKYTAFDNTKVSDGDILEVKIDNKKFKLIAAKSLKAKSKGLSGTEKIPEDGMIFFFDTPQKLVFWMKDVHYPIDIVWINQNEVVHINENVPTELEVPDDYLRRYTSKFDTDTVIELNAGDAKKFNIQKGSIIKIK